MKPDGVRQSVHPSKHFQYDTAPVDSAFSPLSSVSSTIAEARALVSRAESGVPIRRPVPSLHSPTRPETPAVNRRHSAAGRYSSSQSTSRNSLSFTTMLSPLTTPLSSPPVSVDRWSRASSSSANRGRPEREEGDEGDELAGCSEWEEVRPKTAASASKESLRVCLEENAADIQKDSEPIEERKEQLDSRAEMEPSKGSSVETEQTTAAENANTDAAATSLNEHQKLESKEQPVEWHKPALKFLDTNSTHVPTVVAQSDEQQSKDEEKEHSAFEEKLTGPSAVASAIFSPNPVPADPSPRQLDETLISLAYLASKLHDDPASLSDSQLDHLYSLASSCLAHLTSASSITQLAADFLRLRPASAYHLTLHCQLVVALLSSLFRLSRQPDNDGVLWPLLPLLLLPSTVLPSKQTLMCLFSLLVNATMSDEGARAVACTDWMEWLLQRVEDELSQPTDGALVDAQVEEKRITVCVEVTAIMRNIACAPQAHRLFIAALPPSLRSEQPTPLTSTLSPRSPPTALDRLCMLLLRFPSHASLALNVLRILSKLSLHSQCRAVLDRQVEAMEAMVAMLHSFHGKLALCVRVCFTLGNLTMTNADNRFVIADAIIVTSSGSTTDGLSVLLSLLTRTHQRNNKLLALMATASSSSSSTASSSAKHRLMLRENIDLLVKLIRLIANLAIHHDVGRRLVEDDRTAVLVDVLRYAAARKEGARQADEDEDSTRPSNSSIAAEDEKTEELILNAISCMTNLSFYHSTRPSTTTPTADQAITFLFHPLTSVLPLLTPHLLSPTRDTLTSLLRLLANVSRLGHARRLLYDAAVDEAVLLLLSHSDGEVVEVCAGIVLNCSVDEQWADDKLAGEPANLLTLTGAADGDEEEEEDAESSEVNEREKGAGMGGVVAAAVELDKAGEDERRRWRMRSLIGKVLCNMRRQHHRLELDEELIERIESTINEWTMELNDKAEEKSDDIDVLRSGRAQTASTNVDEAELLSVFDAVLTSCSH